MHTQSHTHKTLQTYIPHWMKLLKRARSTQFISVSPPCQWVCTALPRPGNNDHETCGRQQNNNHMIITIVISCHDWELWNHSTVTSQNQRSQCWKVTFRNACTITTSTRSNSTPQFTNVGSRRGTLESRSFYPRGTSMPDVWAWRCFDNIASLTAQQVLQDLIRSPLPQIDALMRFEQTAGRTILVFEQ